MAFVFKRREPARVGVIRPASYLLSLWLGRQSGMMLSPSKIARPKERVATGQLSVGKR